MSKDNKIKKLKQKLLRFYFLWVPNFAAEVLFVSHTSVLSYGIQYVCQLPEEVVQILNKY